MSNEALDFREIYNTFQSKIERYLIRLVGEYEAEDLTQKVFVKVEKSLQNFRGDSQLSTWIYKIATNTALDKLRSSSFHHTSAYNLLPKPTWKPRIRIYGQAKRPTSHHKLISTS